MDQASSPAAESIEGAFLLWERTQRELDVAERGLLAAQDEGDADSVNRLTAEVGSLREKAEERLGAARALLHNE